MSRPLPTALACVGVLTMVAASLWAPPQPELWHGGGACEIAPCGTLEPPERWRTAWWVWAAGLVILLTAVPVASRPASVRPLWAAWGMLAAPLWLIGLAFIAWVASLFASMQGAATVAACGLVAPLLASVTGVLKARGKDSSAPEVVGR